MSLPNKIQQDFEEYLVTSRQVSRKTLRNYRSDLTHFFGWATLHLSSHGQKADKPEALIPHFSSFLIASYKGYHLENKIPSSTVNRRLSTVRNFAKYLLEKGFISENPAALINNLKEEEPATEKLLEDFKKHLEEEGVSRTTLKNYLSDIRQFFAWYEQNLGNEGW